MATFAIDPAHTDVLFSAKHMMVTTVRGTFTDVTGTIEINETDPTASHAEIVVSAASLDTGVAARDAHLRSDDFFGAETYPEIRVMSTAVRPKDGKGGTDFVVTADVTIREVTRSVDFDVTFLGFFTGMDGTRRAGFSAKAKVNRKDWGLDWNVALEAGGWLVGETVTLEVDVAAQELADVAVAA
jgi:polyisoprenoid-binding protein YceI